MDGLPLATVNTLASMSCSREDGGDRLARVVIRCCDDLFRYVLLRVAGDRHAAEEILQQTCFEAAKRGKHASNDADCQGYVFGIARNLIRRHHRRRRRELRRLVEQRGGSPHSHSDNSEVHFSTGNGSEDIQRLLDAIAALDEADQALVLGSYFDGRAHEEMAQEFGTTVRAIEGRLYRARQRLRALLGHDAEDFR